MEKTGCTKKTAEDYLTAARKNRSIVSIYDTTACTRSCKTAFFLV